MTKIIQDSFLPPSKNKWLLFLRIVVAITLCLFLIFSIGITELVDVLKKVEFLPAVGVLLCMFSLFVIGAFNIWILLNCLSTVPFLTFLRIYSCSWAMSLIMPGQAGDASIILFMKKNNVPFSLTGAAYLTDKVITLGFFMLISLYGCLYIFTDFESSYGLEMSLGVLLCTALFFIVKKIRASNNFIYSIRKFIGNVFQNIMQLKNNWRIVIANMFLTVVKWLVMSLAFYLAFASFGAQAKWPDIGVIPILSTLVGYIPISIAGIGTVEVTAVYLFGIIGVGNSIVLSAYLFMRCIQYFLAVALLVCYSDR